MKAFIFVFLIAILLVSCGSDKPDKLPSSNQIKKDKTDKDSSGNDSEDLDQKNLPFDLDSVDIILSDGKEKDRHIVFIDRRPNSEYYERINSFDMPTKFELSPYLNSYKEIKAQFKDSISNFKGIEQFKKFPKEWLMIYDYESDYYFYCPDFIETNERVKMTDSSFIIFNEYGIAAELITSFSKISDVHFRFETFAKSLSGKNQVVETNVYYIDKSKQIAIWEIFAPDGLKYRLMVPASKIKDFPIIVNYGERSKRKEYTFKEINYYEKINEILKDEE